MLLSSFLNDKELPIKEALLNDDLREARRLVNGGSHGLDRFTDAYRIGDGLIS
jgi:peptidoglycan L-alanyl-D-glutamate endopeptidase CwlK